MKFFKNWYVGQIDYAEEPPNHKILGLAPPSGQHVNRDLGHFGGSK